MLPASKSNQKLDALLWKAVYEHSYSSRQAAIRFLELGANPNVLIKVPYFYGKETYTALHLAARTGNQWLIEEHLRYGANQNIENYANQTAIVYAAASHLWEGVVTLAESKYSKSNSRNLGKALWYAVEYNSSDSIKAAYALLKAGADPNISIDGTYTLHLAVRTNNKKLIKQLLDQGADQEKLNYNQQTPMQYLVATLSNWEGVNIYFDAIYDNKKTSETKQIAMLLVLGYLQKESMLHNLPIEILEDIYTWVSGSNKEFRMMCQNLPIQLAKVTEDREKLTVFKKIYNALIDSQTLYSNNNFFADKVGLAPCVLLESIAAAAQGKNPDDDVIAKAWELTNSHLSSCSTDNVKLFKEIYYWSFANSGWFKKSNLLGATFFSSTSLKPELEKLTKEQIDQNAKNNADSRTLAICKALSQ